MQVVNGSISSSVELGYSHTAQNSAMSDLDYSVQSAQDSSDAYLMYRQPRARTTYVENSNQSAHTSSGVYTCTSYSTVSKDTASASFTTENCSSVGCNDSGGGGYKTAVIGAASDQSAKISSSSPVPPDTDSAYSASLPPDTMVASSTSANGKNSDVAAAITEQQVAAIDDCDGVADDGTDELYDLSNAATSDSSYCVGGGAATMATTASDITAPSSSSKCGESGCGNRCTLDGYGDAGTGRGNNGGRSRSGSVVSNSGSFRGDGSDPSEGGRGALLSAAELSDLIVGRKSLQTPRKGFYPSRPTTSSTLDSDSDYVTLPPPMNFLTGAPSLSNLSLANFDCGTGTAVPWDVRHSFDMMPNAVKVCGGHHHHHHHHHHQCTVVNSNNYLDVHKSGSAFYHQIYPPIVPPHLYARQPPPPPPPPRPKRFDLQVEQYKQQLRSDVDFVVYPLQDPAVSRQEYVDAKLARGRRQQQQYHRYYGCDPPSYQAKAHLYRSTPNVAAAVSPPPPPPSSSSASSSSLSHHQYPHHQYHHHLHLHGQQLQLQTHQQQPPPPLPPLPPHLKYASNQNLLFPATVAAAADFAATHRHNSRIQPLPLPPPIRTFSHDDLLAAAASVAPTLPPKLMFRRRPPPPPPPITGLQKPAAVVHPRRASTVDASTTTSVSTPVPTTVGGSAIGLDIELLREKSRNLDLPLISALCNDQTLLKQTNALSTTENKATQTVATVASSSSSVASAAASAASSSHQPLSSGEPQTTASPSNKSNYNKCTTNGASSSLPPNFLSAVASSSPVVVSTAVAVKTTKSKTNHVKTNKNVI